MKNTAPHYLLITEAKTIIDSREDDPGMSRRSGHWRFVLEQMGVEARIEVADDEPDVFGERLELLAVVRGLESLDQPSRVTLLTSSRYVGRGIRQGMNQWRSNQWQWERFGKMTLIKNHDLWRRVDHALQFHSLECRIWDLSQLAPHAMAASARPSFSFQSKPTAHPIPSNTFVRSVRRSNVIRPHGDLPATNRKPIEPIGFSDRNTPEDSRHNIIRVREAASKPATNVAENLSPTETDAGTRCENDQLKDGDHTINTMARVKPPREGRAYGYAVN